RRGGQPVDRSLGFPHVALGAAPEEHNDQHAGGPTAASELAVLEERVTRRAHWLQRSFRVSVQCYFAMREEVDQWNFGPEKLPPFAHLADFRQPLQPSANVVPHLRWMSASGGTPRPTS